MSTDVRIKWDTVLWQNNELSDCHITRQVLQEEKLECFSSAAISLSS
jgi:hypothetical protein